MTAEGVRCQGTAGRGLRTLSTLSDDPRSSYEKKRIEYSGVGLAGRQMILNRIQHEADEAPL